MTPSKKKGFTLVEMLVSVGVFTIVITIAIGALLIVYDAYRKTRTLKNAMENVNIATESMIKKIRTGDKFSCFSVSVYDCKNFRFRGKDGLQYEYSYNEDKRQITTNVCSPQNNFASKCPGTPRPIISSDTLITYMRFNLYGVAGASTEPAFIQDSVTITISGFANLPGNSKYDSNFRIQTTVSKRLLDTFSS